MTALEAAAQQFDWASKDIAYNLTFIPEDKLAWKPAPAAKSVAEILMHLVAGLNATATVFGGGAFDYQIPPAPATIQEAQEMVEAAAGRYAPALRALKEEELGKEVDMGFGTFTLERTVFFSVVDTIHHRGQILYIQTLLGDEENHFFPGTT